jgi:hypothetical protein
MCNIFDVVFIVNLTSLRPKCGDSLHYVQCGHKHLSLSGVTEWCLVSVVRDGVIMPSVLLGMNNTKFRHYVGLYAGC